MKEKTITIVASIIGVVVFIALVAGASFSYYTATITTSNSDNTSSEFTTAKIGINFDGGSDLTVENIIPGDTFTKTFTVTNNGDATVSYQIVAKNVTNTFTTQSDLVYSLKEDNTEIKTGTFPSSKSAISDTLSIDAGETKTYTFTVTYTYQDNVDQSSDMGKSISCDIYIEEPSS